MFLFKLFLCLLAITLASSKNLQTSSRTVAEIQALIASVGGCNANVCFAIDGSRSISPGDFQLQKNFILDVVSAIAGNPLEVSAVQYGRRGYIISRLTPNIGAFNLDIDAESQNGDRKTNIASGIIWCQGTLFERRGEALKIVVLGDGGTNVPISAARRARSFRRRFRGEVCTVGVGFRNEAQLLRIAGDRSRVFTVDEYLQLTDVIEDLVEMICGVTLK